ncbi:MAG: serine/threonine-protein phosphatase [Spartobacteria bacterium]|nr:serine/threonine-protein phosphatase [Spartobacteria bacterium]
MIKALAATLQGVWMRASYIGGIRINPLTQIFRDPELEKQYYAIYTESSINFFRLAVVFGCLLYCIFGWLDIYFAPQLKWYLWGIRYFLFLPGSVILFLITYTRLYRRYAQLLAALLCYLAGLGVIIMIIIIPPPMNHNYYAGLILIMIFGYAAARMTFVWATLTGTALVLSYEVAAIWLMDTPRLIFISNNFFFISSHLVGMMAAYSIEYYTRRSFCLMYLLEIEQDKVEDIVLQLQQRSRQIEQDLVLAREVQDIFVHLDIPVYPTKPVRHAPHVEFAQLYQPSEMVGGDFCSIIPITESHVGVFICDVMGHGMRASLIVATIRGLLQQLADEAGNPGAFLTRMNEGFCQIFGEMDEDMFATAFYCVINVRNGLVRYVHAGHPSPYIIRRNSDKVDILVDVDTAHKGPAVGLCRGEVYGSSEAFLGANDVLFLYTDGLIEAMGESYDDYGVDQLQQQLLKNKNRDPAELQEYLLEDARLHMGVPTFEDDVCMLAAERFVPDSTAK